MSGRNTAKVVAAGLSRRTFLASTAAASATLVAAPFVRRTAHAAGKLLVGLWDHWVPGANAMTKSLVEEWAARERVEVQLDFITSQGNKLLLTVAAEAEAKSGHDILALPPLGPQDHSRSLEPVDDVMQALIRQNGAIQGAAEHLAKIAGRWIAVPATLGSQAKAVCTRFDLMRQHARIDVQAIYPVGAPPKADAWTLDAFLKAAEACHKAGYSFGIGLGATGDSIDAVAAVFRAFGATLIDGRGNITVRSDAVRTALDYCRRLAQFLPADAAAWDDASNNKWLVAGKGALILNPPSAWAVAKRDAPQVAEQCWTHGLPAGPAGRFAPYHPYFWGIWNFSKNKSAAKELLAYLSQPASVAKIVSASRGFDLPAFPNLTTLPAWSEEGAPRGTLYHYPNPHRHQVLFFAGEPAPARAAHQIFTQGIHTKMVLRYKSGESMERTLAWAEGELAGYLRT